MPARRINFDLNVVYFQTVGGLSMFILDISLSILYYVLYFYSFCLLAMSVCHFAGLNRSNPFVGFLDMITLPPCRFFARKFPRLIIDHNGNRYDLSPIAVLLTIGIILIIIQKISLHLGFSI